MGRKIDYTLDTLLDWDGRYIILDEVYRVKIEARLVDADEAKPNGLKYSLTLIDAKGQRIIGYDNAHSIPYRPYIREHDHMHKSNKIIAYEYVDAEQLWHDFWEDVYRVIGKEK